MTPAIASAYSGSGESCINLLSTEFPRQASTVLLAGTPWTLRQALMSLVSPIYAATRTLVFQL